MYYKKHIFICTNQKEDGRKCCHQAGAVEVVQYLKKRVADLGMGGVGGVRVSSSGCMGRCSEGPVMVVYPEGEWFTYHSSEDVENILQAISSDKEVREDLKI